MTPPVRSLTSSSRSPRSSTLRSHAIRSYLPLEPRSCSGKRISGDVFVDVDRLSMLAEVIESGELPVAVAFEWSLAGVFSVDSQRSRTERDEYIRTLCAVQDARFS